MPGREAGTLADGSIDLKGTFRRGALGAVVLAFACVLLAVVPAAAIFGTSQTLSADGVPASQPQVATDRDSNALAVWSEGDSGARRVRAAFRPAGGEFAPLGFLSAEGGDADGPRAVFDERGNALVVWTRFEGGLGRIQAAFRPRGGSFGAAQTISGAEPGISHFDPEVAIDESAAVVWTRGVGAKPGDLRVQAAFRPGGGDFGPPRELSGGTAAYEPHVTVDDRGDAFAVWTQEDVPADPRVYSASKPRIGGWSAAARISEPGTAASQPRVAVDGDGNALAVWSAADGANLRVQSSYRGTGASFDAPKSISEAGQDASGPQVVFGERGEALVAWSRFDGSNDRIQAAIRSPGGGFGAPETLSPGGADAFEPRVAVDESAAVAWTRSDGTSLRAQAAFRAAGSSFGTAQTLSEAGRDAFEPDLAVDERGNVLAAWTRNEVGAVPRIHVSFRPRTGSFAEPGPVSQPQVTGAQPRIATDRSNNAIVVWTADSDPLDPVNPTFIQAAFRPAGGAFGAPVQLSDDGAAAFDPQVAFEKDGDAVIAWTATDADGTLRVQYSFRPAGASFLSALTLSADGGDAFDPRVAAGTGSAVVWSRFDGSDLRAQVAIKPEGEGFAAPQTLSPAGENANAPRVGVGEDGTLVAAWFVNDGRRVDAATGRTAPAEVGPAVALSHPGGASEPQVAVDESGNALVLWTAGDGSLNIHGAFRPAEGAFGAPAELSGPDASDPQVAFDERGNAIAVWTRFAGGLGRIETAVRPAGGAFGTVDVISDPIPGASNFSPRIASDDCAAVVWSVDPDVLGPDDPAVVKAAFRPAGGGFGDPQRLSAPDVTSFEPDVAVDERGNALAVWTAAPGSLSAIQFAYRPRI